MPKSPSLDAPVKVVVSGAFSTGKSTLVERAARRLEEMGVTVVVVEDVARRSPLPLNRAQTIDTSTWLLGEQLRAESEAADRAPSVVLCDRAVLDILSHTETLETIGPRRQARQAAVRQITAAWATTYDLTFWAQLDPAIPPARDGLRTPDGVYRAQLEHALGEAFRLAHVEPLELPFDEHERIALVVEATARLLSGNADA